MQMAVVGSTATLEAATQLAAAAGGFLWHARRARWAAARQAAGGRLVVLDRIAELEGIVNALSKRFDAEHTRHQASTAHAVLLAAAQGDISL